MLKYIITSTFALIMGFCIGYLLNPNLQPKHKTLNNNEVNIIISYTDAETNKMTAIDNWAFYSLKNKQEYENKIAKIINAIDNVVWEK